MSDFLFIPVDLRSIPDSEIPSRVAFADAMRQERQPEDPPVTEEDYRVRLASIPNHVHISEWVVREHANGPIIGNGHVNWNTEGNNPHVAGFTSSVLPAFRQRGIARELLARAVSVASEAGKTLLTIDVTDRIPAGACFMDQMGAKAGLVSRMSQLRLSDVSSEMLDGWISGGPSDDFDLLRFDSPVDPEILPEGVALVNRVFKDVPHGDLEMEPFQATPEMILEMDQQLVATGGKNWVLIARDRATGAMAGVTMLSWRPQKDFVAMQGITGVLPEYRRRGIGRWLKAIILKWVMENRPEVRVIRTENAETNAAMLGINIALGFRPFSQDTVYQITTEEAKAYLKARGVSV